MKTNQTREEVALRAAGFVLIQSRDNRFVVTERATAQLAASRGLATAPHATPDEAWRAAHQRTVSSH